MLNSVDLSGRPFHFIGVGGIGMSALAYILTKRNLPVSGSDLRSSNITQHLQDLGAQIFWQQDAKNLQAFLPSNSADSRPGSNSALASTPVSAHSSTNGYHKTQGQSDAAARRDGLNGSYSEATLPQVICSTAIHQDNLEYQAAQDLGCPIFHRADLLAALMQEYQSIAVAGTHGKTTTSSLIGYLMLEAGLDPTIVVGGEVKAWQGNARLGQSPYLVAEADESDGSLVKLAARIGIITNIELDHPDHYKTLDTVIDTFQTFAQHCQIIVASLDCPTVQQSILSNSELSASRSLISYSLNPDSGADYTASQPAYHSDSTTAQVWERGQLLGELTLKLLGAHNLSNALAAVAVGRSLGLSFAVIAKALASFEGARRRFELRGEAKGIRFIDDYAHHPSEIQATLASTQLQNQSNSSSATPWKRVVAVFQPHRYSRTLTFLSEFSKSFADADMVVVTDIYSAGEPDQGQVSGKTLTKKIADQQPEVYYRPTLDSVIDFLTQTLRSGDLVIFLGAGNLNQVIPELVSFYQGNQEVSQEVITS